MSRLRLVPLLSSLLCALGALFPGSALAQNPAAAEALFEQARSALAAGSYDIACARFRDSDRLDPAVGTRFNLADCEERRGRLATAWSLFRGVLSELAQDDDRKPIAEQRVAKLEPRLPIVTMVLPPDAAPGMRVRIDGAELGEASFGVPLPMDPGSHELHLLTSNGPERKRTFVLREGEHSELALRVDEATVSEDAAAEAEPQAAGAPSSRRRWAFIVGGVGVGGVAVGAITGVVTLQKKSTADENCSDVTHTCNQLGKDANESGRTFAALSSIGFSVGVVGLAAGAYLFLTSKSAASNKTAASPRQAHRAHSSTPLGLSRQVRAQLWLEKSSGFVSVAGRF